MAATPSTDLVWKEIHNQIFAVLGFVTPSGEARTAGIVYAVQGREVYIATDHDAWKTRHIGKNPNVSLTVTISKRVPLLPWIKIPPATATFQGSAAILRVDETPEPLLRKLFRGLELDDKMREEIAVIRVTPRGDFLTYGIGVSLMTMRHPEQAHGRAPTGAQPVAADLRG
jgi:hypothetical protein